MPACFSLTATQLSLTPLSVVVMVVVVTVVVDDISDVYKWFDIDFDHFGRTSCPEPKKQLDWPQTQVQGRGAPAAPASQGHDTH